MVFGCFAPITGGRVSDIVSQESKCGGNHLPLSKEDDKFEKFCETYKSYIDVNVAYATFSSNWEKVVTNAGDTVNKKRWYPLLLSALVKSFNGDLLKAFFSKLTWSILVIFSIWFFVFEILEFINERSKGISDSPDNYEFYLCAGFFVCMFVLSVGIQQMGIYSAILGAKVKAALTTAIYKKMIGRDEYGSKANIVSLVAKDVEKLAEACTSLQYLWSGIVETAAVMVVVYLFLGATILPGLGLMLVFLPMQYILGLVVAYRKKNLGVVSAKRISLMEEIMRGIKLIKIYGWELSFSQNLEEIRTTEARMLARINRIKAAMLGLIFCLPPLMCMVIFGTQEATGEIESVVVFTCLSFFNTLRVPFSKLPKSLRDVLDAFAAIDRIQEFLFEPDLPKSDKDEKVAASSHQAISFSDVSLSYGIEGKVVLADVNLNIKQGSLMMVAGPVASGKSNLLKSILGDLTVRKGHFYVNPHKAYAPQTPWTALGTVRDNIVFGLPFDEAFYRKVLHACSLETDLKIMEDGDQTWIGERGGNLSGGQKQRIALARAAYSRAGIYVLDSPLSAVDMYTCQHIFKYCIKDLMIAGGGTVVLATHQTELFKFSDHLVVMRDGEMAYNDKYTYDGIKHLFPNFAGDGEAGESAEEETKPRVSKAAQTYEKKPQSKKEHESTVEVKPPKVLTRAEKRGHYAWYIHQMGVISFIIATLIFICGQIVRVYGDYWISVWSKRLYAEDGFTSDAFYAGMYSMLVFVFLFLAFLRAFFFYWAGKNAANVIHLKSSIAIMKAPMHFFHVTPIGKLLSFFSHDIDVIDDVLVDNLLMLQIFFWILILALGVVTYNVPIYLAIAAGLAVVYCHIVRLFVKASKPLKEAAHKSGSDVVAHTSETLSGIAVVRAFGVQERFISDNLDFQGRATVVNFSLANLSLWLAFRVDIIGSLLVLACALLAVLDTSMLASDAGLIVSNSFQILLFFSIMSRTMGEAHDNMSSVEDARKMTMLEAEHEPAQELTPPANWPVQGKITFDGVVMPYLPGHPPVLKGISFSINEGEKIGVVGRTGAGKSSLIAALYRLAEISDGKIHVDSMDCSTVSLKTLRQSMAIIPQEPVMFGGTIRTNVDPFNLHSTEEILDALRKCLLGHLVDTGDGMDTKVETLGSNFSLGTQQLMCLARAMLNPSRILLLDEATAALDSDTNAAVQHVLKSYFSHRTILTIAHRLDTIIDSDRILVMNAGVVAEFDRPDKLLENPESLFYELCMNTGKAEFQILSARARAHFASQN
jgi:ABC-type multidrug transport system fused ATPase/permease subunit